jgi:hypothetical protein
MSLKKKLIRQKFEEAVFKRDGFKCKFCSVKENLDAHHITDRNEILNGGYVKENGITLCEEHHEKAEIFHCSGGTESYPGMSPEDLYKKIGSSYEIAVEASKRL